MEKVAAAPRRAAIAARHGRKDYGSRPGRLRELADRFASKRILVCGDLMLDHYIRGKVSRISPEAPVPVIQVKQETHVPGGAGNVCSNLASLGSAVTILSVVGADAAGDTLLTDLRAKGIDTGGVAQDPERQTTQKVRLIGEHQQLLRYDRETTDILPRPLERRLIDTIERQAQRCHAIVISDYGKGIISPPVLKAAIAAARGRRIPITVDPKIEHFKRYRGVDCITPNLHEAWAGMRLIPRDDEDSIRELGGRILKTLRAYSVLITRGEKGMTLFENSRAPYDRSSRGRAQGNGRRRKGGDHAATHIPAQAKEVFDVTGAGDTVVAVLSLALACGATRKEAAALANKAAGLVVAKLGTATVTVPELKAVLK